MKILAILISFALTACAPWMVDKPQRVADSRVQVCKRTGSRITKPCEASGSISEQEWDEVRSKVAKPTTPRILEPGRRRPN